MNSFPDIRPAVWSPPAPEPPAKQPDALALSLVRLAASDGETKARLLELVEATEKHNAAEARAAEAHEAAVRSRQGADQRIAEAGASASDLANRIEAQNRTFNEQSADIRGGLARLAAKREGIAMTRAALTKDQAAHARQIDRLREYLAKVEAKP